MLPRRIAVPIDFSELSERALDYAIELAGRLGGMVALVHVIEPPAYQYPGSAMLAAAQFEQDAARAAEHSLAAMVEARRSRGVDMETAVLTGVPWEEITSFARRRQIDLVVIGTRGRRGFARALLGSVATNVIRMSEISVLVLPAPT